MKNRFNGFSFVVCESRWNGCLGCNQVCRSPG